MKIKSPCYYLLMVVVTRVSYLYESGLVVSVLKRSAAARVVLHQEHG